MRYLFLFFVAMALALLLTPFVRRLAKYIGAVDQPGERKIHTVLMPRLGGVSVIVSGALTIVLAAWLQRRFGWGVDLKADVWLPVLTGGTVVFLVGVWDDIRPLPAWIKFLCQAAAACIAIGLGIQFEQVSWLGGDTMALGILSLPLTFIWIIGITNAFNLIDGLDGLATGLAIITAATCATIFVLRGSAPQETLLLIVLLGGLLGFLRYNFNPATIFLGDSGSLVIGYVLAVTAISGLQKGVTTFAVLMLQLTFGLPIIDTLLAMVRRFTTSMRVILGSRGGLKELVLCTKQMFAADKRHIHHQLLALGFSHRNAVLLLYALGLGLSFLSILSTLAQYRNAGAILSVVGVATYLGIRQLGYHELVFFRTGTVLRWCERLLCAKHVLLGSVDVLVIALAYWVAFFLKYEGSGAKAVLSWYAQAFPLVLAVQFFVFYALGLYRRVWRTMGGEDLIHVPLVGLTAVALSYVIALLSVPPPGTLHVFWIDALLLGTLLTGIRSSYYILDHMRQRNNATGKATLIYGTGHEGQLILRALLQDPRFGFYPIGFLDDDPLLQGRIVCHIPVLGSLDDLQCITETQPIACLIIASNQIEDDRLYQLMGLCQKQHISVIQGRIHLETMDTNHLLQADF